LSFAGGDSISWTWSDADPDHWDIEESADGVTGWSVTTTAAGSARSEGSLDTTMFYRIIGRDSGGTAVTLYSNVVEIP
jgi:hypothetical protein